MSEEAHSANLDDSARDEDLAFDLKALRAQHACDPAGESEVLARKLEADAAGTLAMQSADAQLGRGDMRAVVPQGQQLRGKKQSPVGETADIDTRKGVSDFARLVALEEECRSLHNQLRSQEKGILQLNADVEKHKKTIVALQSKNEKETVANRDLTNKLKMAETQLALVKKEVGVLQRHATTGNATKKSLEQSDPTTELRLKRALEALEAVKSKLAEVTENGGLEAQGTSKAAKTDERQQNP